MWHSRHSGKKASLQAAALKVPWQFSAGLAIAIFVIVFLWLPRTSVFGPFGSSLYFGTRSIAALLQFLFTAIAVYEFLRQRRSDHTRSAAMDRPETQAKTSIKAPAPNAWSLAVIRDMEWKRFEDVCLALYHEKGIRAVTTPLGPDGGIDIRLYEDQIHPECCTGIVQCKAWGERYVGVKPVHEFRGVMAHEGIRDAVFMTPGTYSEEAQAFASTNHIALLDGKQILMLIQHLPAEARANLLRLATAGDWTTPTCPSCGTKMLPRESNRRKFWGCRNFPGCRQILGIRTTEY